MLAGFAARRLSCCSYPLGSCCPPAARKPTGFAARGAYHQVEVLPASPPVGTRNDGQSASSSGMSCHQGTTSHSSFSMAVAIFTRRRTMANQGSRCNRRRRTKENQRNQERKRDQEEVKEERITGKEDRRLEDAREGKDCIFFTLSLIFYLTRLSSSWTKNSFIFYASSSSPRLWLPRVQEPQTMSPQCHQNSCSRQYFPCLNVLSFAVEEFRLKSLDLSYLNFFYASASPNHQN